MSAVTHRTRNAVACTVLLLALAACAHGAGVAALADAPELLLLGEVHDNPEGQGQRNALLRERIEAGWRPVIAMEVFDREHQHALDRALRECGDADCVVRAAAPGSTGWQWPLYAPVIELALRHRLRIVAANISRADLTRMMREGPAAALDADTIGRFGLDAPLPAEVLRPQVQAVREGHCGMLPEPMLEPMARAQIARDVWMAKVLLDAGGDAVLVAGNGHVREDIGAPFWLRRVGAQRVRSVAWSEDAAPSGRFGEHHVVAPVSRPDPCEAFRTRG